MLFISLKVCVRLLDVTRQPNECVRIFVVCHVCFLVDGTLVFIVPVGSYFVDPTVATRPSRPGRGRKEGRVYEVCCLLVFGGLGTLQYRLSAFQVELRKLDQPINRGRRLVAFF